MSTSIFDICLSMLGIRIGGRHDVDDHRYTIDQYAATDKFNIDMSRDTLLNRSKVVDEDQDMAIRLNKRSSRMEEIEEAYESDCEDIKDYGVDGYHAVYLGEKFKNGRYQVIQKLGWGHFSTVWLAEDLHFEKSNVEPKSRFKFVAMKVQRSKESHGEAALDEVQLLKALTIARNKKEWISDRESLLEKGASLDSTESFCIEMLDHFVHFGDHGRHYCSTFEIMGPTLLDIIRYFESKFHKGVPVFLVKKITQQILIGLHFSHKFGRIIHTDLKPENVMIQLSPGSIESVVENIKKRKKLPQSMRYLKNQSKLKQQLLQPQPGHFLGKRMPEDDHDNDEEEVNLDIHNYQGIACSSSQRPVAYTADLQSIADKMNAALVDRESQFKNIQGTQSTEASTKDQAYALQQIYAESDNFEQSLEDYCTSMSFTFKWKEHVDILLDENIRIKIVDFGNACWTYKHFTDNIQTREYRSLETIVGLPYTANTDIWSLGCMIFELLTSDYLFRPHSNRPEPRDEVHLALFMSTLGKIPRSLALGGKYSNEFFKPNGLLKHAKLPKEYPIDKILVSEYKFDIDEATAIRKFLTRLLEYDIQNRADAWDALMMPWTWTPLISTSHPNIEQESNYEDH